MPCFPSGLPQDSVNAITWKVIIHSMNRKLKKFLTSSTDWAWCRRRTMELSGLLHSGTNVGSLPSEEKDRGQGLGPQVRRGKKRHLTGSVGKLPKAPRQVSHTPQEASIQEGVFPGTYPLFSFLLYTVRSKEGLPNRDCVLVHPVNHLAPGPCLKIPSHRFCTDHDALWRKVNNFNL